MSSAEIDISSPHNKWIKLARSLSRRRRRYQERAFLVEGIRPLQDAIDAGVSPVAILVDGESDNNDLLALARRFESGGARVFRTTTNLIALASDTETPQGILGIYPMSNRGTVPLSAGPPLYVIADRIRDPGNLGTLMRTALAAGVHALLVAPQSADPYSPKVVRAATGAHFRLPFITIDWGGLPAELNECVVLAAHAGAKTAYDDVDLTGPVCIIIGNETQGLSPGANDAANLFVGIPLANAVESLNAATAGAVVLFEAARQRRRAGIAT